MKNFINQPEGISQLEDLGRDGRTILKWIFTKQDGIPLAQDRGQWQDTVKMANKPLGSTKWGEFINYLRYLPFQEGLGYMDCKSAITNVAMVPNLVLSLFTHEFRMLICQQNRTFIS
jgi:hypothetical protein